MKKTLLSVCLALITGMAAQAQSGVYQIPNSDFNNWAADNEPGNGWNSFASAGGSLNSAANLSPQPSKDAGRSGAADDYSCKIYSKTIFGVKANGNLTVGRINMGSMSPANSSNYNYTDRTSDSHSLLFAGRPDAVEFYAKFTSGGSPNGRGQFILHGDVDYRDPEISDQEAYKVGIASVLVPASDDWQLYRGEFTYSQDTPATQYMLASFTTNPTPGGSQGDYLWIDDVNFIYYHSLTALSYEGTSLSFDEGTLTYDLSSVVYDESKLSYTKKGAGATVETAYDETSGLLTITVKGNDFAVNSASVTAYTIQFDNTTEPIIPEEPQLGAKLSSLSEASTEKTYVLYNEHFTAYAIYNGTQSETNVWTAGMIGDDGHALSNAAYGEALDATDAGSSWMVVEKDGRYFLYNMGAKKYLTTPGYADSSSACTFSVDSVSLSVVELGDGNFAFSATGSEKDYMCAAPQLSFPLSIWTSSDSGSAWQLIENPNVEADAAVAEYLTSTTPVDPDQPKRDGVYQIPNSDFNNWAADNEPGNGWNSFASAGGALAAFASVSPAPVKEAGRSGEEGDFACKIFSKNAFIAKANGNLTTGRINMGSATPEDAANYNFTDRTDEAHSLLFAGRPDAVEFYAKFKSGGSPNGRGQFILHGDTDYRDPETSEQATYQVGVASVLVPESEDWTLYRGEFSYSQETPETQYMLASFTTNPTPGGSQDDYLWIDDVNLIYYHSLSALAYEDAAIDFNENTLEYDLSSVVYDESKLSYTKKGAGATVETAYDETTRVLTITVKGNDFGVNPASVTTYQVQFGDGSTPDKPELGEKVASLSELSTEKTYVIYNEHFTAYAIYNAAQSETNIWTAGMIGDDGHALSNAAYGEALDATDAGSSWMVVEKNGSYFLYNMGAKKCLTTPGYVNATSPCTFSEEPVALTVVELGDGNFAFTATGADKDYMCAAPQGNAPISIWTSSDTGSAWQFKENPNVEADPDVLHTLTGISAAPAAPAKEGIYSLSGLKLGTTSKSQLPAGIYIVNGKKVVVGK